MAQQTEVVRDHCVGKPRRAGPRCLLGVEAHKPELAGSYKERCSIQFFLRTVDVVTVVYTGVPQPDRAKFGQVETLNQQTAKAR